MRDEHWQTARIRRIETLTPTIRRFDIVPDRIEGFAVGSHIDVAMPIAGETPIRSYSLIGRSGDADCYSIAVKLLPDSRGGSRHMWTLEQGAELRISRPISEFELEPGRDEYVLVAGGIGVTPIVGMALDLVARGASPRMVYAVRSSDELAFVSELRAALNDKLIVHIDQDDGLLDLGAVLGQASAGATVAICGPLPMLEAARRAWRQLGRAPADLRFETFGSSGARAAEAFVVKVVDSDREIQVPADRSLLDALEAAGIGVVSDCKRGECGVCMVQILDVDGGVDHRDVFMSDEQHAENTKICACVSRAFGTLTIDTGLRSLVPA